MNNKNFLNDDSEFQPGINGWNEEQIRSKIGIQGILDEHTYWLRVRGYDEKGLGNNEQEGMYKEHLKMAIQQVQDSGLVLFDNEPVTVHTFGYFGKESDKVFFTFNYSYNATEQSLSLQEVQAMLDQTAIAVHIETFDDLWPSQMMHARVKELSTAVNEVLNERHQRNIKVISQAAYNYLKEKGYDSHRHSMERKLNQMLNKADKAPCSVHYFNLKTTVASNTLAPVKLSIHFVYYKDMESLKLNWIHATCDNSKQVFFNKTNAPIPPADYLISYMNHLAVVEKARKITEAGSVNKPGRNIKK